jgi:TonB family protein
METLAPTPVENGAELHLLTDWERDRSRVGEAGVFTVVVHVAAIVALILVPRALVSPPAREVARVTPLIEPLTELTQKAPNKGKVSKEITADATPRPRIQIPAGRPSTTRPAAAPPTPPPAPPALPAPPSILPPGPQMAQAMPPQIQPEEKPKIFLETPTAPPPSTGRGKIAIPDTSVSGAIRSLARGDSASGLTVGDSGDIGTGGIGAALNLPPSPGRTGSSLQLLSDPLGVDFRPYLIRVLASVRRNWFAVFPESAKLGRRGRVEIQFAISKDGSVPKLVIAMPSGAEALDRAAVAGISASNPFPPLPTEFAGNVIKLQFTFLYNIKN